MLHLLQNIRSSNVRKELILAFSSLSWYLKYSLSWVNPIEDLHGAARGMLCNRTSRNVHVVSDYGAAQQLHPFGRSWEKSVEQELGEREMPQL